MASDSAAVEHTIRNTRWHIATRHCASSSSFPANTALGARQRCDDDRRGGRGWNWSGHCELISWLWYKSFLISEILARAHSLTLWDGRFSLSSPLVFVFCSSRDRKTIHGVSSVTFCYVNHTRPTEIYLFKRIRCFTAINRIPNTHAWARALVDDSVGRKTFKCTTFAGKVETADKSLFDQL